MIAVGQTSICFAIIRRRTYRQRKKPCTKNPDALTCAIRHRRCKVCPFNNFFKKENILKYTPPVIDTPKKASEYPDKSK